MTWQEPLNLPFFFAILKFSYSSQSCPTPDVYGPAGKIMEDPSPLEKRLHTHNFTLKSLQDDVVFLIVYRILQSLNF